MVIIIIVKCSFLISSKIRFTVINVKNRAFEKIIVAFPVFFIFPTFDYISLLSFNPSFLSLVL